MNSFEINFTISTLLQFQNKQANRRVNFMITKTKSANQSVIDDAIDNDNTAITLAGPTQPDDDDYGYVSQEASAFYNKFMEKYNKIPGVSKFDIPKTTISTDLGSTKERVQAALEKAREETTMPHKRKRKNKHIDGTVDDDEEGLNFEAPERPERRDDKIPPLPSKKKPKPAHPPLSFSGKIFKLYLY